MIKKDSPLLSTSFEKKVKRFKKSPFFSSKKFWGFSFVFFVFYLFYLASKTLAPTLPSEKSPCIFYSNQCRQDLKSVLLHAIFNAKHSLHLVTFGLNDASLLKTLEKRSKDLDMKIFYDPKASPPINLTNHQIYPVRTKGFMHQKILVLDETLVFLGSANMTHASLNMHDNLLVGLYSPLLAKFLIQNTPFYSGHFLTTVGTQRVEAWLLPDSNDLALKTIQEHLRQAKKKITVAMFTFTHPILLNELIQAKNRGVSVTVLIDYHSALGTSSQIVDRLKKEQIPVVLSRGSQLFHHKYVDIDHKILIFGSTNWTKSAFQKNKDCFLILSPLSPQQRKELKQIKKTTTKDSF